jgi:hypothetical protein
MILVVDLDRSLVLCSNSDAGHAHPPLFVVSPDAVVAAACASGSSVAPAKSLVASLVCGCGG